MRVNIVAIENLPKEYTLKTKAEGARGVFSALLRPCYRCVKAVHSISFSVAEGKAPAFIGPNGAGKSTTIKMLTGILHPTAGRETVRARVPWRHRELLA